MGERGPSKKPTALKLLEGNPGKRAINKAEPKPPATSVRCPAILSKGAKAIWKRRAPVLFRLGLLTDLDVESFAQWCQAWADWEEATAEINKRPLVKQGEQIIPNPYHTIRVKASNVLKAYSCRFGLSPGDRAGLAVDVGKPQNPFSEFD